MGTGYELTILARITLQRFFLHWTADSKIHLRFVFNRDNFTNERNRDIYWNSAKHEDESFEHVGPGKRNVQRERERDKLETHHGNRLGRSQRIGIYELLDRGERDGQRIRSRV